MFLIIFFVFLQLRCSSLDAFHVDSNCHAIYSRISMNCVGSKPLLVRAYLGENTKRTPIWLMRQAGRYMSDFRKFSEKYSFRERSETPDIAIELSLQPWKRFDMDGVIMFSDILTPLPAMGIDFTMIEGKGPKILNPIRSMKDVDDLISIENVENQVPFLGPILNGLSKETKNKTALIGFIGAPWTLAAYAIEGGHNKLCRHIKQLSYENPLLIHKLLQRLTNSLCHYASYQISCGAEVIQVFESWAHFLSEDLFSTFVMPYADQIALYLKTLHPSVPVVYFANGGSQFLQQQKELHYDSLSLDWRVNLYSAHQIIQNQKVLAGNLDPMVLYCRDEVIEREAKKLLQTADSMKFVCNLGHGIEKDMSEHAIGVLVNTVKNWKKE